MEVLKLISLLGSIILMGMAIYAAAWREEYDKGAYYMAFAVLLKMGVV